MITRLILSALAIVLFVYIFSQRNALRQLTTFFYLLIVAMVAIVWTPNDTLNNVANTFGVGRAADLAFYLLFTVFIFVFVAQYLFIRRLTVRVNELNTTLSIHLVEMALPNNSNNDANHNNQETQ